MFRKLIKAGYRLTTLGLSKGPHVTRYYMYQHLNKFKTLPSKEHRTLSISHSEHLAKILGFSDEQIIDASYPAVNILDLPFSDREFDAVVSDQVLEHVKGDPQLAVDETFRVLKPNGFVLHTTCFINPIHDSPDDFWRFSPEALKLLVEKHGEIIDVDGWGNPYVWIFNALGLRFESIPHARWHPAHWVATKRVPHWSVVTWVLAKKKTG